MHPDAQTYIEFLKTKIPQAELSGFEPTNPIHPSLFPHQRDISEWCVRGGRRACFASFGLGKTRIQLEIARQITGKTGGRFLIICPLQLDIIKRLITRYTNEGDMVFDPFGGIGSVPYQAIKMNRRGMMTELNGEYFRCAVGYCEMAENEITAPTLFDLSTVAAPAETSETSAA